MNDISHVTPVTLKSWIHDGDEIALLDVREHGQYGEEHLFYVVSIPYSKLEIEVQRLVPRKTVRLVLIGDGETELTDKARQRLFEMGYSNIHVLEGGVPAWRAAGFEVFAGVNLPSKAFGELAEHAFNTPRISAQELNDKIVNKENIVVLDGRPYSEYKKMSIPTAVCCPNGELPLRIDDIVKDPETTIVINCAGRTRSIIGAQTLINLGIPNKVLALENGTQGWYLEDLQLNHGDTKRHPLHVAKENLAARQRRAKTLADNYGIKFVDGAQVKEWLKEKDRTTFLCDVRTPEEFDSGSIPGAQHSPGGQLVQATDQYVGVKGARIVVFDQENVRAPAMATWLTMLGWEVVVCENALTFPWKPESKTDTLLAQKDVPTLELEIKQIEASEIISMVQKGAVLIDIRPSMKYRESHIKDAQWSIRPKLSVIADKFKNQKVILIAEDDLMAKLAAKDLIELGAQHISINTETKEQWVHAGLEVNGSPSNPPDEACIDYLFFVHDRHDGNKAAARQYLAWEMNLLAQIDQQERESFRFKH
ncbi:rhodanese-like domain-containing protein [Zwartia sp.]|uniref:rhodanese-like domain-containing protein n=1 Tax=Zwartia sp. TaxID=2978004 RepID=UPI002721A234|nr:rhodanese-like domain-containing protein [Zwartia sp.]MDO9023702.1 rhodanese-like domain-containing protein [Zwartia sp.]